MSELKSPARERLSMLMMSAAIAASTFASVAFAPQASAAVPKPDWTSTKPVSTLPARATLADTRNALKLPLNSRLDSLIHEGKQGYRNLVSLMFDESIPMEVRWRAVTAAGRIGGDFAKPEMKRAFENREWYMRNAALISMSHIDRAQATEWARRLLSDKSLVVRTAAVSTLSDFQDQASASLLWQKLYAKENFRGKQSLFIRKHIVETLARLKPAGSESKFVEVLADHDATLHPIAIHALELLTAKQLGNTADPLSVKRAQWQRWWKDRSLTL